MTEKQDPPEYVTIYRTAQEMLRGVESRHPDARVTGNVRVGDIAAVRDVLQQLIWESGRDSS